MQQDQQNEAHHASYFIDTDVTMYAHNKVISTLIQCIIGQALFDVKKRKNISDGNRGKEKEDRLFSTQRISPPSLLLKEPHDQGETIVQERRGS